MELQYCSITGADEAVDIADLCALGQEYSYVEWAILCLPSLAGTPRYPGPAWITDFAHRYPGHKAMHLCGDALMGFIAQDPAILELMDGFERIQLNLKFGNVEGRYDPADLLARIKESPQFQFIIQYTPDKAGLLPDLKGIPNHALLYDASAGEGISPERWEPPIEGHFCGYAGGLNPDNIQDQLAAIAKVAAGHKIWIDLETGARTDNRFGLAKARQILDAARFYIK